MDKESVSSQEGAVANGSASSFCDVCRGFGEEGHLRGQIIPTYPDGEFTYIYVHYPTLVSLSESAQTGCQICAMILHAIKERDSIRDFGEFDAAWAEAEELEGARKGAFDVAPDTFEVARLLDNAKASDGYCARGLNASSYNSGRIVLLFNLLRGPTPREFGLRKKTGAQHIEIKVLASNILYAHDMFVVNTPVDSLDPGEACSSPAQDILSEPHLALVRRWLNVCASEHSECNEHHAPAQENHSRLLNTLGRSGTKTFAAEHEETRLPYVLARRLPTRLLEISSDPTTRDVTGVRIVEKGESEGVYACLSYCWGQSSQKSKTTKSNVAQYRESIGLDVLPGTIIDALKVFCKLGFRYVWIDSLCIIQDDNDDWQKEASNMAAIYSNSALTLAIHLSADSSEGFLHKRLKPKDRPAFKNAARLAYTDEDTGQAKFMQLYLDIEQDIARFLQDGWVRSYHDGERPRSSWLDRAWTFQEWLLSPRVLHIHEVTVWDCFEGYGNEHEYRFLTTNTSQRAQAQWKNYYSWNRLVAEYTSRSISHVEDRLPALAGLAEKYQKLTGFRYLAGIWSEELPFSLLWRREGGNVEPPTVACRIPSWSWAALESDIDLSLCSGDYRSSKTSVVSAHVEYCPHGSLSTVSYGWLDIKGPICLVVGFEDTDSTWETELSTKDKNLSCDARWDRVTNFPEYIAQSQIYLLEVSFSTVFSGDAYALIIKRTEKDGGKDTFQRLGLAWVEGDTQDYWEEKNIRLV